MKTIVALSLFLYASITVAEVASEIDIHSPFARAALKVQRNSAVFMQIENRSVKSASVVGAESPVADTVELHTHINDDGVMRMRRIPYIDLPTGAKVELKPGGLHVMLLGLKQDLQIGQKVGVTLHFDDGSKAELLAPVKKVMRPKGMTKHGQMMKH